MIVVQMLIMFCVRVKHKFCVSVLQHHSREGISGSGNIALLMFLALDGGQLPASRSQPLCLLGKPPHPSLGRFVEGTKQAVYV